MVRVLNQGLETTPLGDTSEETRFYLSYNTDKEQICRGYAYVSFTCFFFTFFLFFIKICEYHSALIRTLIKLKGTAKFNAQGERV